MRKHWLLSFFVVNNAMKNPANCHAICRVCARLHDGFPQILAQTWVQNPPAPAMSNGQNRSGREKTRKAEISRDFSAFFAPNFFRISIDPFSIFFRVEGFELPKTHFFQNFITNESNTKDLNPRQGLGLFRFFVLVTKCLQIVYYKTSPSLLQEDLNPRITKIDLLKPKKKATATKPWQILFEFNFPTNWNLIFIS